MLVYDVTGKNYVDQFNVLSRHLAEETKENYEKSQSQ
jgi:hypothetical protein